MSTIALINKHYFTRAGIEAVLNNTLVDRSISTAENLSELFAKYPDLQPELVLLGVNSAMGDPVSDELALIRTKYPKSIYVVMDESFANDKIIQWLRQGMNGYLHIGQDSRDLIDCIDNVLHHKHYLSIDAIERVLASTMSLKRPPAYDRVELTNREQQIAQYLYEGLKTSEIAHILNLKTSTVSTFKMRILKKFNVVNTVHLSQVMKNRVLRSNKIALSKLGVN